MKKLFLAIAFFSACALQGQNFKELLESTQGGAYIGGGMNLVVLPTIKNTLVTGSPYSSADPGYEANTGFTMGMIGKVGITPIRNPYFSYTFNADLSEAWLFNYTGSFRWLSHNFEAGYKGIFFTFATDRVLKRYSYYARSGSTASEFTEELAHVRYSGRRRNYGLKFLFKQNPFSYLKVELINERYPVSGYKSTGYKVESRNNSWIFASEFLPKHFRRGAILHPTKIGDIEDYGAYFHFSVAKVIGFEGKYKAIKDGEGFFSRNYAKN